MNKQTVEGKFDQIAGAVKQKTGEAFDDQSLANSGVADQVKGAAKETVGHAKDIAEERKEAAATERADRSDSIRDHLVEGTQKLKDHVNAKLDEMRDRRNA
jgi:uncharacterized protein YjbJ (UPF0337 family)